MTGSSSRETALEVVAGLNKAQREALLWLPEVEGRTRDNDQRARGASLKALERKGLCHAGWTPFPRTEHPWYATAFGILCRSILLEERGES